MSEQTTMTKHCECVFAVIPSNDGSIRPSLNCPLHKTLAERWDAINFWADFYDALKVDSPEIENFEAWCETRELTPDRTKGRCAMTHTHTIESGNARVSVEADDAARAVSEARRNWELNNGGVVSDTAEEIAGKIADAYYPPLPDVVERHLSLERAKAQQNLIDAATPILASLVRRAEAAERERDTAREELRAMVQALRVAASVPAAKEGT